MARRNFDRHPDVLMNATKERARMFERAGFTLARVKNHPIWRCPCGHKQVSTSGSHCEGRTDPNVKALIARTLRVCHQRMQESA